MRPPRRSEGWAIPRGPGARIRGELVDEMADTLAELTRLLGGRTLGLFTSLRRILGEAAEIESVDLKQEALDPKKIPLLLVVRPKGFTDVETFRLDQYLMKGGRVIMFVSQGEIGAGSRFSPISA